MSEKLEDTELQETDSAEREAVDDTTETGSESINPQQYIDADQTQAADHADVITDDDAVVDSSALAETAEQESDEGKKNPGIMLFLFVLLTLLLGGLAANGQLQPLYNSFAGWVASFSVRSPPPPKLATADQVQQLLNKIDGLQSEISQVAEAQKNQPPPQPDDTTDKLRTELNATTKSLDTLSSNTIANLTTELGSVTKALDELRNNTIASLSSELNQLSEAQKALHTRLQKQQQLNLQLRLRWITHPASRLPQFKLAWEEISLLAGLTDEEYAKAEKMHTLARDSMQKIRQWQTTMQKWADTLALPVHKDIVPKLEHPWLSWVNGHFHLRPAPSEEIRQLNSLRAKLGNIVSQLTTESWPAENDWQQLRAQLVLQARTHQAKESTEPVELNLPDSFEAIKSDINTLQQTAQQWLGES